MGSWSGERVLPRGTGATLGEPLLEIPSFSQSPGQALPVGRHVAEGNKRVAERGGLRTLVWHRQGEQV